MLLSPYGMCGDDIAYGAIFLSMMLCDGTDIAYGAIRFSVLRSRMVLRLCYDIESVRTEVAYGATGGCVRR
eukprot:527608-Rhodomonas_salina.1